MGYKTMPTLFLLALFTFNVELVISNRMDCCLSNGNYKVEKISGSKVGLGEGPHWDIPSQSLYYVDIYGGTLCRYSSKEHKVYRCKIGELRVYTVTIRIKIPPKFQRTKRYQASSYQSKANPIFS